MEFDFRYPDLFKLYRIDIVQTRYGGSYEGGPWTAFSNSRYDPGCEAFGHDLVCAQWWDDHRHEVGLGATPNDALQDLIQKVSIT